MNAIEDLISEVPTETCPRCYGRGWVIGGWGHFGDCNGDAGEGWKPCYSECDFCLGRGAIKAES